MTRKRIFLVFLLLIQFVLQGSFAEAPVNEKQTANNDLLTFDAALPLEQGYYVNHTDGTISDNPNYNATGYVSVQPEKDYIILWKYRSAKASTNIRIAYYDELKQYLDGAFYEFNETHCCRFQTSGNVKWIRFSFTADAGEIQMDLDDGKKYTPDGNLIRKNELDSDLENLMMNLPSALYAVAGTEMNVYFENLVENWEKYSWDVYGDVGQQLDRGFRVTATENEVGEHRLTFAVSDGVSRKLMTTTLKIASAKSGEGKTVSMIILGDSTTDRKNATKKISENFSDDPLTLVLHGTRGSGDNRHEGRSGWSIEDYFTRDREEYEDYRGVIENPFYNPETKTFDAQYYFDTTGTDKPDWFMIHLGINDMFSASDDEEAEKQIETSLAYLDQMTAGIHKAAPETRIGICLTIPPNHSQDAFGKSYSLGQTRNRCKRNNLMWVHELIGTYDLRTEEGIYLVPLFASLDTVYNMGTETLPVNARNTKETYISPIANGTVHPSAAGYWQLADVYTAFLKNMQ